MARQVPSVGRIVHYIMEDGRNPGQHRPAIIVKVWADNPEPQTACQLQVFTDDANDGMPSVVWKTSRQQGDMPGQWHFPEYVAPVEE